MPIKLTSMKKVKKKRCTKDKVCLSWFSSAVVKVNCGFGDATFKAWPAIVLVYLHACSETVVPTCHELLGSSYQQCRSQYIPPISQVRGPYGKLWIECFPSFYGPSAKRAGHENKEGKNEDP